MASSILGYFGLGGPASPKAEEAPGAIRALPANWYTSSEMYELERRAIFSRKWLMITHQSRLKEPGSFLRQSLAGFDFVLTKDRNHNINAFHNVCRHRAFPVVETESGNAKILACRYHGWSYGLNGKLAKAPGYQEVSDFDKSQNGLFSIHTRIDANGFIWLNFDGKETPEIPWEKDFGGVDTSPRFANFNFDDYEFDHTWDIEAEYNWKIAADNYNECYHCKTTHPDIPAVADLETYDVQNRDAHIDHDAATTDEMRATNMDVAATYYFPNSSMNVTPNFFFIQKFMPMSPSTTFVRYEVYRNKNASDADFKYIDEIYKRIMSEDKELCSLAQKNLNAGIFINGELHPKMEKGPLYFQKQCRDTVVDHHKKEKKLGAEIWPARQTVEKKGNGLISNEDVEFCEGLSCGTNKEELVW